MTSPERALFSPRTSAILAVIAILIGIGIGIVAAGDRLVPGDVPIARFIQRMDGNVAGDLANIGNMLGSTVWAGLAIVLALGVAATWRSWADVVFLTTLLILRLAGTQIKPLFDSPRPTNDLVLITGVHDGTGYPSGHSLTAATLALGLAVLAWRHIPSRGLATLVIAILIGLGLLVGWARIWVGAHWPSDVVGGYAFGVATVALGMIVLSRQIAVQCSRS